METLGGKVLMELEAEADVAGKKEKLDGVTGMMPSSVLERFEEPPLLLRLLGKEEEKKGGRKGSWAKSSILPMMSSLESRELNAHAMPPIPLIGPMLPMLSPDKDNAAENDDVDDADDEDVDDADDEIELGEEEEMEEVDEVDDDEEVAGSEDTKAEVG